MPREGPAYPISDDWREQVADAIDELKKKPDSGITSRNDFAEKCGIAASSLTAALKPDSVQSTVMPQINAALGWPAPRVLSTPDELEIWAAVEALDERTLGRMIEKAEAALEKLKKRRD